ncbi:uncharacterized protein LOC125462393 isoform X3 [Stegostoma tigrinum]|uniref:uncharacterized protein LOC125462393 isoform X3 n=1 Tax=Stegostoma tigrinum TaxID=3053191 RepID=UPI00202B6CA0|nr:uncharacterized protein LOC125462393 isoform X3 [Stegostoma tigrinum]
MSNHEWTRILTGFGKGCCTNTILTDQAKEMTVLRDQPYRTNVAKEMQPESHLGARAMHKSTLTLGKKSAVSDYTTSYKQYFISQKAQPIFKFSGYPDEIKHLGVNTDGKEHLTTHREAFFVKEVIPVRKAPMFNPQTTRESQEIGFNSVQGNVDVFMIVSFYTERRTV